MNQQITLKQIERLNQSLVNWGVNYSVYPYNSYTMNELLMQFFSAINSCIDTVNESSKLVQALAEWITGEGLQITVNAKLDEWLKDGTLEELINEKLLADIMETLSVLRADVNTQGKEIEKTNTNLEELKNAHDNLNDDVYNVKQNIKGLEEVDKKLRLDLDNTYREVGRRITFKESLSSTKHGVKFIAHRGASGSAPENTLRAFEMACKLGFWGFEFDARYTQEYGWYVMHDNTVDRTTNGTGAIENMKPTEIEQLRIDGGKNVNYFNKEKVPSVYETLLIAKKYNAVPVMEMKSSGTPQASYDSLANTVKSLGLEETIVIIGFDSKDLIEMKKRLPKASYQFLWSNDITEDVINVCTQVGDCDVDCGAINLSPQGVALAHKNGLKVNCWTVNDEVLMRKVANYGVDYITTDYIGGVF